MVSDVNSIRNNFLLQLKNECKYEYPSSGFDINLQCICINLNDTIQLIAKSIYSFFLISDERNMESNKGQTNNL